MLVGVFLFFYLFVIYSFVFFFFSSRRRHTRSLRDWSSDGALPISGRRSGSRPGTASAPDRRRPPADRLVLDQQGADRRQSQEREIERLRDPAAAARLP